LLRLAIDADPEFAPAWGELGMLYGAAVYHRGWGIAWADSALAVGRRAIELAPDQPDGYRALAFAFANLGQIRAYQRAARKIVELAPSDAFGVNNVAVTFWWLGELPEAVEWYRRGIGLHPHRVGIRINLADLYAQLGLLDRAEEQLRVLSVLDPSRGHDVRATLRLLDGELDAALESAKRHAQRSPVSARIYFRASKIASMAGDHQLARAWAEEAANLGEGGITTRYGGGVRALPLRLGFAVMSTGNEKEGRQRMEQGLKLLRDLIDAGAEQPSALWDLAASYSGLGRQALAVEWARKAIDAGYKDNPRLVEMDPLFEPLRGDPNFERILARIRADQEEMARRVVEQERMDRSP
jgi:tetratricopeptide (TPR) repeat protein